jgi:hypothetical protein
VVVKRASGTGQWTRLGFAGQVVLALALALGVCLLVVHLSEWRRFRARIDLTAGGRNTLDPQTEALLAGLEEPVRIDIFFRPATYEHVASVTAEAQQRMSELLFVANSLLPEKVEIRSHDLLDVASAQKRMDELGIEEVQTVVVSLGERREVLRLFAEIAELDVGNPDPRAPQPAALHAFRGEEALAEALKKVSAGDTPRVYFSTGHGEPDPFGTENHDLGALSAELRRQGFEVRTWDGASEGPVPDDCDVLALVGLVQPLGEAELAHVRTFVETGGRLFVTAEPRYSDEPGSVGDVLARYGMLLTRGVVCLPVLDYFGNPTEGVAECADFRVGERELNAQHPVTAPLVERGRKVRFVYGRSFDRGEGPAGSILLDLASSPNGAWRDLPGEDGTLDFVYEPSRETSERFRLAMATTFPALREGGREARVVGVASPYLPSSSVFGTNRDFLLNAFNWLAARDFRVGVSSRDPERSVLDLERGRALSVVFHTSLWGLPGVFGLLGAVTFLRRRR